MDYRLKKIDYLNLFLVVVLLSIYIYRYNDSESYDSESFLFIEDQKVAEKVKSDTTILKKNRLHISHSDSKYLISGKNGSTRVNINSEDITQLTTIPGIGKVTAKKIVAYRKRFGNFKTFYDLLEVKGIGKKKLEKIKKYIKFNDIDGE